MAGPEHVLVTHRDAAWLPPGGRADVVLAGSTTGVPTPACLVRLLVTRDRHVLTQVRADGHGRDIPTRPVVDADPEDVLDALVLEVLGSAHPATLLGWVRNTVPDPTDDYPWPSPRAHFVVWHCTLAGESDTPDDTVGAESAWLNPTAARAHLGQRHWWPLAAHLLGGSA